MQLLAAHQVGGAQDTARALPPLSLKLNIPAFRLDVQEGGRMLHSYRVAVGLRAFPTPTGDFVIREVTWNPWWHPPKSAWAARDTVTPPGPANPVGKVKMQFDSRLFVHGTPAVTSLGRAASHACVRLSDRDAVAIALLLQQRNGGVIAAASLDSLLAGWEPTRAVTLTTPVPFSVVYALAEVRDSSLVLYPDLYRKAKGGARAAALAALTDAGLDTGQVARPVLERALGRAQRSRTTVLLRNLFPPARRPMQTQSRDASIRRGIAPRQS